MSAQQPPGASGSDPWTRVPELMLALVSADGTTIGNTALRRALEVPHFVGDHRTCAGDCLVCSAMRK